jgi:hypothetical protein
MNNFLTPFHNLKIFLHTYFPLSFKTLSQFSTFEHTKIIKIKVYIYIYYFNCVWILDFSPIPPSLWESGGYVESLPCVEKLEKPNFPTNIAPNSRAVRPHPPTPSQKEKWSNFI